MAPVCSSVALAVLITSVQLQNSTHPRICQATSTNLKKRPWHPAPRWHQFHKPPFEFQRILHKEAKIRHERGKSHPGTTWHTAAPGSRRRRHKPHSPPWQVYTFYSSLANLEPQGAEHPEIPMQPGGAGQWGHVERQRSPLRGAKGKVPPVERCCRQWISASARFGYSWKYWPGTCFYPAFCPAQAGHS